MASAFQSNAFQFNAFQTATNRLVAPTYSLGSPAFATPQIAQRVAANTYSLGAPTYGTPTLISGIKQFTAPNYSLGSPVFATPSPLRQTHSFAAPSYSLGGLDFALAGAIINYQCFANAYSLGSPSFGSPPIKQIYVFAVPGFEYSLGSPDFATPSTVGLVTLALKANDYWLGSPVFHYPRLSQTGQVVRWPPFYADKLDEGEDVLAKILEQLMGTVPPKSDGAYAVRREVGYVLANDRKMMVNATLGQPLYDCWTAAFDAGATFEAMDRVRRFIMDQVHGKSDLAISIIQTCLLFTLITESRQVAKMEFKSRDEVAETIKRIGTSFEEVRLTSLDLFDASVYEAINGLSAMVMQHLYVTELQLPRIIDYTVTIPRTALALANLIYNDTSRWIEIVNENHIVHPAFCLRELRIIANTEGQQDVRRL